VSLNMILQICAGMGILVYGVVVMGDAMQVLAGDGMRALIGKLTSTKIKSFGVGCAVAGILHSSGATSVMVVSFVEIGVMGLAQAICVLLGANVGTTLTAQLIAFDILPFAYFCILVGGTMSILFKDKRLKQFGACLTGFALLFVGINMMKGPLSILSQYPAVGEMFCKYKLFAFLFGLLVTAFVHSSAATVGLTMAFAAEGIIDLQTAIIVCIGENIGTTATAVLAAIGTSNSAKQTAAAHVIAKCAGSVVIALTLPFFTHFIELTSHDISRQIANTHTIFNVIIAIMFMPFVSQFAKLIQKIFPDDEDSIQLSGAIYLNRALIDASPATAVHAVKTELLRLAEYAAKMIVNAEDLFLNGDEKLIERIKREERNVDKTADEIIVYATELGQTGLSAGLSNLLNACTGGAGDAERIGDHATNLVEIYEYLKEHKLSFSETAMKECKEMFDMVIESLRCAIQALRNNDVDLAQKAFELEDKIDDMEVDLRAKHIARLNAGECKPGVGVAFIDMLSNLERVGDHANNLASIALDEEHIHCHNEEEKNAD